MKMSIMESIHMTFINLVTYILLSSTIGICTAREGKHLWLPDVDTTQEPVLKAEAKNEPSIYTTESGKPAPISVINFGAKGDGKTNDAKAFQTAWAEACKTAGSTMLVPSGYIFLLGPVSFLGTDCKPNIVVQLDGTLTAMKADAWDKSLLQWIDFSKVQGFTFQGKGTIDGQGQGWWTKKQDRRPTALRFYGCNNLMVNGIKLQNSPKMHLKFDNCKAVQVSGIRVTSPGTSPNTDGIHLQNSQDVTISGCSLACGDDCISIQTGCSNVDIHNVTCGPGHGFSFGGLGQDKTKACVSNINIRDVILQGTMTGVRIKTWQGATGNARKITFSNVQVSQVGTPIVIDQYYCDGTKCVNSTSAIAISDITYNNIRGTYTVKPISLACSDSVPCTGISLSSINLSPAQGKPSTLPYCEDAYGLVKTTTTPSVSCLKSNKQFSDKLISNVDTC